MFDVAARTIAEAETTEMLEGISSGWHMLAKFLTPRDAGLIYTLRLTLMQRRKPEPVMETDHE